MKKSITILMVLAIVLCLSASAFAVITPGVSGDYEVGEYIAGHNDYIDEFIAGHNYAGDGKERPRAALSNVGLLICLMEDDSLYQYIPMHQVMNVEYKDIDTLKKEYADALREAHDAAEQIEGKTLKKSCFFSVPENFDIDNEHYAKYLFSCEGKNVEVFVNGNPVEVVSVNGRTSYIAKVTERGCITITVDK